MKEFLSAFACALSFNRETHVYVKTPSHALQETAYKPGVHKHKI